MMRNELPLLARYAEGLFWMARYLERVENIARLIDVTQNFESPGRESESWFALVRINADEAGFAERGLAPGAEAVKRFYLLDHDNPTSVPAALEAARMNARTLRPLISTEMWVQLNVFHRDMVAIDAADLQGDRLSRLCARIKEGVQTHTGITEGTFFRDQGWLFYQLGRQIERADQTTRMLDIRYHLLVPATNGEARRVAELTQWGGVLRAAAGYHAFRRIAPAGFTPADVVGFLLRDNHFPRSVALCLEQVDWVLNRLRATWGLRGTVRALEQVEELRTTLLGPTVQTILDEGLHHFLDHLQCGLIDLAGEIGTAFFRDWRPYAEQSQKQG
ncbi:Alpha-E domain-containing protein [Rhodovastum atsumiense]|uniref:Alpha-E domain-containing protein n=1 Tax=Rhodovastum atsumiense TaxID=504468 RepID=A0A5M6IKC1_9PROT|nr:alpha-E domain-containing protein [Rhodovastum atsumiense]KAA5608704.1 alpha-E domain-containing protein [Rhodovastum atsumiense]CAH2599118.1 Alpha-E domain-containing protein [Rhodovastum atsumiense]